MWAVAVPPQTQIDAQVTHEAHVASVADAWRYLLDCGKALAHECNIKPEDLILGQWFLIFVYISTHVEFSDASGNKSGFLHPRS